MLYANPQPTSDGAYYRVQAQATNLYPPSLLFLHANRHPCLTFPSPLTAWVSAWLAAIQSVLSSKPWLRPTAQGVRGGVGAVCGCAKPAPPFSP